MQYTITIDDDDREDCPLTPWTATAEETAVSGIGATPSEALADLARDWQSEDRRVCDRCGWDKEGMHGVGHAFA